MGEVTTVIVVEPSTSVRESAFLEAIAALFKLKKNPCWSLEDHILALPSSELNIVLKDYWNPSKQLSQNLDNNVAIIWPLDLSIKTCYSQKLRNFERAASFMF